MHQLCHANLPINCTVRLGKHPGDGTSTFQKCSGSASLNGSAGEEMAPERTVRCDRANDLAGGAREKWLLSKWCRCVRCKRRSAGTNVD